jgi:hypothetical protein
VRNIEVSGRYDIVYKSEQKEMSAERKKKFIHLLADIFMFIWQKPLFYNHHIIH